MHTATFASHIARVISFLYRATVKGHVHGGHNNFQGFLFQAIKAERHYSLSKAFRKKADESTAFFVVLVLPLVQITHNNTYIRKLSFLPFISPNSIN